MPPSWQGAFRVSDLLHWSAVCGCGLDTVPVPGPSAADTARGGEADGAADAATVSAMAALLLDLAATAYRLDKPLACRLLPLPGKAPGDVTTFGNPYLVESKVMPII